ncbi:hypothetical protein V6N11_024160 [Hibiscus sabdariffa]|uniref:Uncharacterized protein n=1 Tax=Hibiscus sabdariffa TaxID=183260 RepID=A0ABR1ZRP1_9ROSI
MPMVSYLWNYLASRESMAPFRMMSVERIRRRVVVSKEVDDARVEAQRKKYIYTKNVAETWRVQAELDDKVEALTGMFGPIDLSLEAMHPPVVGAKDSTSDSVEENTPVAMITVDEPCDDAPFN